MALEIERKFLVTGDFKNQATSVTHIVQGYITSDAIRTVRVRIYGEKAFLTIKGTSTEDGLSRFEFETEIKVSDARDLLKLCDPAIIDKNRYLVPFKGHTFEVDEFFGTNQGLVMAEVELSSPDETFDKPTFLGKEVTGDKRYYNSQLRLYPVRVD